MQQDFSILYKSLKEGRQPPLFLLEEAIENFLELSYKEQVTLIVFGKEIPSVREVLEKKLPLSEEIKEPLLKEKFEEVIIPVVDTTTGEGKLSKIFLIKNSPKFWTNAKEYENVLISKILPLTGKSFIALFEETLKGYSFLLPLAVALIKPHLLEKYCFSGNLDSNGKLLPILGEKAKEKACKRLGKPLIISKDFETLEQLLEYLGSNTKPIPILISAKNRNVEVLNKNYNLLLKNIKPIPTEGFLEKILNSKPYTDLGILETPEDWKNALNLFEEWINKIDAFLEDAELHIALDGPSPLAFAYGIMHGAHKRAVFYHFQGNNYHPLVVVNEETSRGLKEFIEQPQLVEWNFSDYKGGERAKSLAVILDMVSHPIEGKVKQFLETKNIKADILLISHRERGKLNINRTWTRDIAEIFTLIRNYLNAKPYEEILFFFGTPVALAFGLGVAFGHYANGKIYSFYPNRNPQYVEVLKLEEIKKVR